jgi:alkanesulfonate monooxygenase SsuD/methylene tetrahydromethanopterin reductase-like flavin-dependent oxidoreductase (luciferase family)
LRIGIYLDLRNPAPWKREWISHYARNLELIQRAETLGIDSVWLSEHHFFADGYLSQPLIVAAAVAARTTRMRIGTSLVIAPIRHPVHLAEQSAILDILSSGRFELGLGSGYRQPEFEAFGIRMEDRYPLLEQRVSELRRLWAGQITPLPIQDPLPLWVGGTRALGARRAGRLQTGLLMPGVDPELVGPYLEGLGEKPAGPTPARVAAPVYITLSEDPEADWPRLRPHVAWQWDTYRRYGAEGVTDDIPPPVDPDRLRLARAQGRLPMGTILTPEDTVRLLVERIHAMPFVDLHFWLSTAGMPDGLVDRHLELLASRVKPLLLAAMAA